MYIKCLLYYLHLLLGNKVTKLKIIVHFILFV